MNKYETIFIINPSVSEENVKALIEKFTNLINNSGSVEKVTEWGKKRLKYPIKKVNEGYYVLVDFESDPSAITELERIYRITDEIIKFIVVRKED